MPGTSPAKRPPTRTHGPLVTKAYAAINRRELPATTPDWVKSIIGAEQLSRPAT